MRNIDPFDKTYKASSSRQIKPLRVHHYLDLVQCWLTERLPLGDYEALKGYSSSVKRGRQLPWIEQPAYWCPRYVQCVRVAQPEPEALMILDRQPGVMLNYIEPAHDVMLPTHQEADQGLDITRHHFVQHHHVKFSRRNPRQHLKKKVTVFKDGSGKNWRTGYPKKPGISFQFYGDRPSKVDFLDYCLHIEMKINGKKTLKRMGINRPRDVVEFPFQKFWEDRLRFYAVDYDVLNRWEQTHRKPKSTPVYSVNRAVTNLVHRFGKDKNLEFTMQQLVNRYGMRGRVIKRIRLIAEAADRVRVWDGYGDLVGGGFADVLSPSPVLLPTLHASRGGLWSRRFVHITCKTGGIS